MHRIGILAIALAATAPTAAAGAVLDVMWVSGSPEYNLGIINLARAASEFDPAGDGSNVWNLTIWDSADTSSPTFGDYDVLVIGSTYAIDESYGSGSGGTSGFFGNGVSARGVLANGAAIEAARGERTFLTGQDADWHNANNRPDQPDGPFGFLVNAVNWAASGGGLGIVSMTDRYYRGEYPNIGWWTSPGSFLADELGDSVFANQADLVFIGTGQEAYPISEGLTSSGLSGWNTSSHALFFELDGYTRINFSGANNSGFGVTIVTAGHESGGTDGPPPDLKPIPLPGSWILLLCGLGSSLLFRVFIISCSSMAPEAGALSRE